jgi:hypothetical protein
LNGFTVKIIFLSVITMRSPEKENRQLLVHLQNLNGLKYLKLKVLFGVTELKGKDLRNVLMISLMNKSICHAAQC